VGGLLPTPLPPRCTDLKRIRQRDRGRRNECRRIDVQPSDFGHPNGSIRSACDTPSGLSHRTRTEQGSSGDREGRSSTTSPANPKFNNTSDETNNPFALALVNLVGATTSDNGHPEVHGFTSTSAGRSTRWNSDIDWNNLPSSFTSYYIVTTGVARNETIAFGGIGHWLVQVVPEPGTALLLGTGLLGVAWKRRGS